VFDVASFGYVVVRFLEWPAPEQLVLVVVSLFFVAFSIPLPANALASAAASS
jgi:hypothetical protein